jgi:hypothetical protein
MMLSSVHVEPEATRPIPSLVQVETLERTDTYVVAVWRRVVLLVWRSKANATGVERSRELFEAWMAREPGDAAFLIVVPGERTRAPDGDTFHAMARTAGSPISQCKGMATLLESKGFIAASVRTIMMRIHSIAARQDPPLVFGSTSKAARWAAELLDDPGLTSVALAEALRLVQSEEWSDARLPV